MTEIAELGRVAVDDAGGQATFDDVVDEVTAVLTGWPGADDRLREIVARALSGEEAVALLPPAVGAAAPDHDPDHDPDDDYAGHRVVDVEKVADGVLLTHRLTAAEQASDLLDVHVDLALLGHLGAVYGGLHLPDGTPLWRRLRHRPHPGHRSLDQDLVQLRGPAGWLRDYEPGGLVVCSAKDGVLTVAPLADDAVATVPGGLPAAVAEARWRSVGGSDEPVPASEVQLLLAAEDPLWFAAPRPPFSELVTDAGLMSSGNEVGEPDTWAAIARPAELIGRMHRKLDLPEFHQDAFGQVMEAFDRWRQGEPAALTRGVARNLGPGQLAPTVLAEMRVSGASWEDVEGFADEWGDLGVHGRAVMLWFTARARAALGDPVEAERLLEEAHTEDSEFTLPLVELAELSEERGDFRAALRHLAAAGEGDSGEADRLRRLERSSSPDIGRNEPCPCGSGRKFKQCHLGRSTMTGPERVRWLLGCAERFMDEVADPKERGRTARLADHVRTALPHADGVADEDTTRDIQTDLELFDQGWLTAFLDARGPLADETVREEGRAWADNHVSSVFRVEDGDTGGHVPLVDLATGERYEVDGREVGGRMTPHRLIWCRLIPVGDAWSTSGAFRPVHLYGSRQLLTVLADGSVDDVLEALVRGTAGQPWHGPDGEPLVDCRDEVRPASEGTGRDEVIAALDRTYEPRDDLVHPDERDERDVTRAWAVHPPARAGQAPVGRVIMVDDGRLELSITTLSGRARLREEVTGLLGELTVEAETSRPRNRRDAVLDLYDAVEDLVRALDEQARTSDADGPDEGPGEGVDLVDGADTTGNGVSGATGESAPPGVATDAPRADEVEEIADAVITGQLAPDEVDWSRISSDPQVQEMFRAEVGRLREQSDELCEVTLSLPRAEFGGRTLREVADEPDRRPEVLTLLAEVEDQHGPGFGGWVDRVRAELDL